MKKIIVSFRTILLVIAIGVILVFLVAPPAMATTVSECQAAIAVVKGDLAGVEIRGGNPERTLGSLESKLDGADLKLDQGKFADALAKVTDFRDKVSTLQSQGKISDGTSSVADLLADADSAILCIEKLVSET